MHRLLERQIARHLGDAGGFPPEWRSFLEAIDASYGELEADYALLERSLELSSQELLQANSRMRAVLQAFPDLFLWIDGRGEIIRAQTGEVGRARSRARELVGTKIEDLADGDARREMADAITLVRETRTAATVEYAARRLGETQFLEARLLPLPDAEILAIVRDITGRKLAEEALNTERERLAVTLRSIADGVIATDAHGSVILMNRVAEQLTGWSLGEAFGRRIDVIYRPLDRAREAIAPHPVTALLAGEHVAEGGSALFARDGSMRPVHGLITAVSGLETRVVGAVIVLRDMTDHLRAEEEHIRSSKLESLGLLAGGIAHDFNNILAGIMSNLSVVGAFYEATPKIAQMIEDAELACHRAKDLTRQLLTFSKGGAPVRTAAPLPDLLREVAVFALRGSNVTCAFEIADDLLPVDIDVGQIGQVINNLVINADQAMPGGGTIVIQAENAPREETREFPLGDRRYVRFRVVDTGVGIPADYLEKIFDPYFTTKVGGSGLGLATSYSIVKRHDGVIAARLTVGAGTTMTVHLPVAERLSNVSVPPPRPLLRGRGRVLVMDDEEQILRSARRMLEHLGFRVDLARDGGAAIRLVQEAAAAGDPFDAAIVDLTIPGGMGGKEAAESLSAGHPTLRIIASSGYCNDPIFTRHADYGFSGILPKPYNISEMSDALAAVLG